MGEPLTDPVHAYVVVPIMCLRRAGAGARRAAHGIALPQVQIVQQRQHIHGPDLVVERSRDCMALMSLWVKRAMRLRTHCCWRRRGRRT
jgi:hypothetical protein